MSMGKFKLALKDYEAVAKYKPNDPDNKKKLAQCKKVQILRFKKIDEYLYQIIQQKAFERAIASEEKPEELLPDFKDIKIDDSYSGPVLSEDGRYRKNCPVEK